MRQLFLLYILLLTGNVFAQTPTVPASNIQFAYVGCNEFTATWTNGNGNARLVFISEGSVISDVPQQNEYYTYDPIFGKGESIKSDNKNFCVYRGTGSSVTVTGLKSKTRYYIAVFEYNGGAAVYDYLTSGFPKKDTITKTIVADGYLYDFWDKTTKLGAGGQCLYGNSFQFKNKSECDISPLTFTWTFGNGDSSNVKEPNYSYKNEGLYQVKLIARAKGCYSSITFNDTVYPHPKAKFELDPTDTIQCYYGNSFTFKNRTTLLDIGVGLSLIRYEWYDEYALPYGYWFSTKYNPVFSFKTDGKKRVKLVAFSNRGCKDSTFGNVYIILPRAINPSKVSVSPKYMTLKNNKFTFTNSNTRCVYHKWYLKKDSSNYFFDTLYGQTVDYSFKEKGIYYIILESQDSADMCIDQTKDSVVVKQDVGIMRNDFYSILTIYPNPSQSGVFTLKNLPLEAEIKVCSIIGKELLMFKSNEATSEINLNSFGKGTFVLNVKSSLGIYNYKLLFP